MSSTGQRKHLVPRFAFVILFATVGYWSVGCGEQPMHIPAISGNDTNDPSDQGPGNNPTVPPKGEEIIKTGGDEGESGGGDPQSPSGNEPPADGDGGSTPGGGAPPPTAELIVSSSRLDFGDQTEKLTLTIFYTGTDTVHYELTPGANWFMVDPAEGTIGSEPVVVLVGVYRALMAIGSWEASLAIATDTGLNASVVVAARLNEPPWPAFAFKRSDQTFHVYSGAASFNDALIRAEVVNLGNGHWQLQLTPKVGGINTVWFPWQPHRYALNGDDNDDVILYPRRMGVGFHSASLAEWEWQGQSYPGQCFTPIITIADRSEARTIAAMNWPPRLTTMLYSRGRATMSIWGYLSANNTHTFDALVLRERVEPGEDREPWYAGLDLYRDWLQARMAEDGLYPIEYPQALRQSNGMMSVWLHYDAQFDVNELRALYDSAKADLSWVQFWGQMSNYMYCPGEGLVQNAVPPLAPGEEAGCCLVQPWMHSRYLPSLPAFADEVRAEGGHIGYYSRPSEPYRALDGTVPGYLDELLGWLDVNAGDGANAFYLDVLGGGNFGDVRTVARLFQTTFPAFTFIEFPVDAYPVAYMISGCYFGGYEWMITPGHDLDDLCAEYPKVTFPRYGRYLLDDRIVLLGGANGDRYTWGMSRGHDCYLERKAFMLGAKFEAPTILNTTPEFPNYTSPITPAVRLIIDEWRRVGWWDREPRYRDRDGISGVPEQVEVSRFIDRDGITLLCVDNWYLRQNASFRYRGMEIPIPQQRISIIELMED